MPTREQLEVALINADKAGDAEAATMLANAIKAGEFESPPQAQSGGAISAGKEDAKYGGDGGILSQAAGQGEALLNMLSSIAATPIAGIAGLGGLLSDPETGSANVDAVMRALTYGPRTPEGIEAVKNVQALVEATGIPQAMQQAERASGEAFESGGPAAAAVGYALPTAVLEMAGLGAVRRVAPRTTESIILESPDVSRISAEAISESSPTTDIGVDIGSIKAGPSPESKTYEQISTDLRKGRDKRVAEQVMPQQDILDAAEDLGVDLNPSHYSSNRAYIDVEQSLKSRPGSRLAVAEEKSIIELGERADQLINDIGGETDKSLLDLSLKSDIDATIRELEVKSSNAYRAVDSAIPREVVVNPKASIGYLDRIMSDLGGNEGLLSSSEKRLLQLTKEDVNTTYTALDRLRKDVGNGFRKNAGPYKDDDSGTLKQVYRVLSEDQQGVADSFGVGADYSAARRLVKSRKDLEDNALSLFGRDVGGSIVPKLTQSGAALTKGDVSRFNKLIEAIPPARRQEAVATMLNELFSLGARTKGPLGQGFVKAYEGLSRNKLAKDEIFKHLPDGAEKRFDQIAIVAAGIFRSKSLENNSKTARDIISAMDDGGMFSRVLDVGRKAAIAEGVGSAVGIPGAGTAGVLGAQLAKSKTKASVSADELIASPEFRRAVETAARANDPKRADLILSRSGAYSKWLSFLDARDAAQISTVGFIPWVTGQSDEERQ